MVNGVTAVTKTSTADYIDKVIERATQSGKTIQVPKHGTVQPARCSLYNDQGLHFEDHDNLALIGPMIERLCNGKLDSICIIENIDGGTMRELGNLPGLYMPPDFFVGHASGPQVWPLHLSKNIAQWAAEIDDMIEEVTLRYEKARSHAQTTSTSVNTRPLDPLAAIHETILILERYVNERGLSGQRGQQGNIEEVFHSEWLEVADLIKQCKLSLQDSLTAVDADERFVTQLSAIVSRTKAASQKFERLRSRPYFNLSAAVRFDWVLPDDKVHSHCMYKRELQAAAGYALAPSYDNGRGKLMLETKLSYIRAHEHLCIILVDALPAVGGWSELTFQSASMADEHIVLPRNFESASISSDGLPSLGLYETCNGFARRKWHREVMCSKERLPSQGPDYPSNVSRAGQQALEPAWAACNPRAFLYLLSSHGWEANLRCLVDNIRHVSFHDIPKAASAKSCYEINARLHSCRAQLDHLQYEVAAVDTHIPQDLQQYYDLFPRIKRRGKAAYLSPVENHRSILERSKDLDKLLIDSFQLLTNSVSVYESHESMKQSRRATWIAVLAFFYLPATLVTGIFGMNITQASDGFVWWSPLVALTGVIALTGCIFGVFIAWRHWRKKRKTDRTRLDVEKNA